MSKKTDRKWVRPIAGSAPHFYSNLAAVHWSLYDMTLLLGQLTEGEDKTIVSEHIASLTVAWPMAKYLARKLTDMVKAYEMANGEIVKPVLAKEDDMSPPRC